MFLNEITNFVLVHEFLINPDKMSTPSVFAENVERVSSLWFSRTHPTNQILIPQNVHKRKNTKGTAKKVKISSKRIWDLKIPSKLLYYNLI